MVSLSEAAQGRVALRLRAIAMDLRGGVTGASQTARDSIGAMLGAHEDKKTALARSEQMLKEFLLLVGRDLEGTQLDVGRGLEDRTDLDADRIPEVIAGHSANLRAQRRRVAERLAIRREGSRDAPDGGLETHVEHAVHFVEDKDLDAAQVDQLALEIIFETAGRPDDQARAAADRVQLRAFSESSTDQRRRALALGQVAIVFEDLHGEFARGQQDECGGAFGRLRHSLDERDEEAERLASAGLSSSDHVAAFQCGRNCPAWTGVGMIKLAAAICCCRAGERGSSENSFNLFLARARSESLCGRNRPSFIQGSSEWPE